MTSTRLQIAHTSTLDAATLASGRALMTEVFEGDFAEDDWEHALGGIHAMIWEGQDLIGHGSVVQRRLLHQGRALRCGYVEAVGVRADRRRQGHASAIMEALEAVIRSAYDLGALGASDEGLDFYRARGWQVWLGQTSALTPTGVVRTPDEDGAVLVFPATAPLDLAGSLTCDWRDGDVW